MRNNYLATVRIKDSRVYLFRQYFWSRETAASELGSFFYRMALTAREVHLEGSSIVLTNERGTYIFSITET